MRLLRIAALAAALTLPQTLHAQQPAKELFGAKTVGSNQMSEPLGSYAKGCLAGGERLRDTGPTWQAMRLSRNRNWGHPEMVAYLKRLSEKAARLPGWKGIYVGDSSQPRAEGWAGPLRTVARWCSCAGHRHS